MKIKKIPFFWINLITDNDNEKMNVSWKTKDNQWENE